MVVLLDKVLSKMNLAKKEIGLIYKLYKLLKETIKHQFFLG